MKYAIAAVSVGVAALIGLGAYYYTQQPEVVTPEVDPEATPAETVETN